MKKSVLITGGSSGIGEATARRFAKDGYHCILVARTQARLEKVVNELPTAEFIIADFEKKQNCTELFKSLLNRTDIDIQCLVNNAGFFERHDFVSDTINSLEIWEKTFQVNVLSVAAVIQSFVPYFRKKKKGSIVNVSSTLAFKGGAQTSAYSASKAAINNLTISLALELGPSGIRVNAVCPGIVDTPIHAFNSLEAKAKEKVLQELAPLQPLGRIGHPEEIAESIFFLGSELSSWTTGALLSVDGGINIK